MRSGELSYWSGDYAFASVHGDSWGGGSVAAHLELTWILDD